MGILFVLAFLGILGSGLAGIGALVGRAFVTWLTRRANGDAQKLVREQLVRRATLFPVGCLAWATVIFVFQGVINTNYLNRDMGLGDSSYCPLPNGYSLLLIDVSDQGDVYNPKTQGADGTVSDRTDAVSGVTQLQISGSYILGASDSQWSKHFGQNPSVDRYFLLNTRNRQRTDFSTENELRTDASKLGVPLKLEPIFNVYRRYRFTWFDGFALLLLICPMILVGGVLLRSLLRLRTIASIAC